MRPPAVIWLAIVPVSLHLLLVIFLAVAAQMHGIWNPWASDATPRAWLRALGSTWIPAAILCALLWGRHTLYYGEGDRWLLGGAIGLVAWAGFSVLRWPPDPATYDWGLWGYFLAVPVLSLVGGSWTIQVAWRIGHPAERPLPRLPQRP